MKIAIVFSGVPRLIDKSFSFFKNTILDNNNVDIFSVVWKTDEYKNLENCYSHKFIQLNQPIDFFAKFKETKINIYSHWYGLQIACLNFKNYVQLNNVEYDFIVRTRHDIAIYNRINFNNLNKELIYVAGCHWPNSNLFDDNLMILNQKNYFKIFENIFSWHMARKEFHNYDDLSEEQLFKYINDLGLLNNIKKDPALDFILTRGIN